MKLRPEALRWERNLVLARRELNEIWTKKHGSSLRNIIKHLEAKSTCRISRQTSERSQQT